MGLDDNCVLLGAVEYKSVLLNPSGEHFLGYTFDSTPCSPIGRVADTALLYPLVHASFSACIWNEYSLHDWTAGVNVYMILFSTITINDCPTMVFVIGSSSVMVTM